MRRKVIKQGHNTLTITLPAKWVIDNNIKPSQELEIDVKDTSLVINSKQQTTHELFKADISNLDRCSILYTIRNLYRLGYDEIELSFENQTTPYYRTGKDLSTL